MLKGLIMESYKADVWHVRISGSPITLCKLTVPELLAQHESVAYKAANSNCPECLAFMNDDTPERTTTMTETYEGFGGDGTLESARATWHLVLMFNNDGVLWHKRNEFIEETDNICAENCQEFAEQFSPAKMFTSLDELTLVSWEEVADQWAADFFREHPEEGNICAAQGIDEGQKVDYATLDSLVRDRKNEEASHIINDGRRSMIEYILRE